jgi:hypothetical protein
MQAHRILPRSIRSEFEVRYICYPRLIKRHDVHASIDACTGGGETGVTLRYQS